MRIADTSAPVVIFKLFEHCGAGIMRSLGRLGISVYGIDPDPWNPGLRSRYCRGRFVRHFEDASPEETLRYLFEVAGKIGGRPILLSNGDLPSLFLADHANELRAAYLFQTPPAELVRSLSDKRQMYFMAKKYGVPTAETVFPQSRRDVLEFLESGRAAFPIMLKGMNSALLQQRTGLRMIIVRDEKELLEKYDQLEDPNDPNLMLQEFIPGGDDSVWMFNGYFNVRSDCLVGFTGRKLRQYPVYVGMTALGICLENEFVDKTTRNFMKQIGYRGILDIGYRYDRRDGQYKLLDVNPRIGATFRLFVGDNGLDVVRALYLDLTGQSVPRSNLCEGRKWVVEDNDFISFRNYRKDGKLTFREWINSFHGVQETAWFAWDDPVPFLIRCGSFLRYLFGFFTKKLKFSAPKVPEASAQPQ